MFFSELAAEKKYSKNGAAGKFFGPSYFDLALAACSFASLNEKLVDVSLKKFFA